MFSLCIVSPGIFFNIYCCVFSHTRHDRSPNQEEFDTHVTCRYSVSDHDSDDPNKITDSTSATSEVD